MFDLTLNPLEIECRTLMAASVEKAKDNFTQEVARRIIGQVFTIQYLNSIPADQVLTIGLAIHPAWDGKAMSATIRGELTSMVREKTLRSRTIERVRHYEVNYTL